MANKIFFDQVYYKSSEMMDIIPDASVDLIVTSPPYFNIKKYFQNGYQTETVSDVKTNDMGNIDCFDDYINNLLAVWKECERVLKPNGKLCINVPLMPIKKKDMHTHYNRDIFDIQSAIQQSIIKGTGLFLMDLYIWHRKNATKKLMFGSYPYPSNFYAQNTCEFITVFVKDGKPAPVSKSIKEQSALTQNEWVEYTKQIWEIPIPNKSDIAFGIHSAIMPEEIARRCIKLYSFKGGIVLDPFAGSGTTLKVACAEGRHFIGFELYDTYKDVIDKKIALVKRGECNGVE